MSAAIAFAIYDAAIAPMSLPLAAIAATPAISDSATALLHAIAASIFVAAAAWLRHAVIS